MPAAVRAVRRFAWVPVSGGVKRSFGAKSAKSCLPSTPWIVASPKTEGVVSASVASTHCRPMEATTIELAGPMRPYEPSLMSLNPKNEQTHRLAEEV